MDLLFRLKKNINNFENEEKEKKFFINTLKEKDNNCFFHTKKIRQSKEGDTIYFAFDGYIIAKAIYSGNIIVDQDRDEDFVNGHALRDIYIIDNSLKINSNIIRGRGIKYINTDAIKTEIQRVLTKVETKKQKDL